MQVMPIFREFMTVKPINFSFNEEWEKICPIVWKVINQESILYRDWEQTFTSIHKVCYGGDEKVEALKLKENLSKEIAKLIDQIQLKIANNSEDLLKSYITEWKKFIEIQEIDPLFSHLQKVLSNFNSYFMFPLFKEKKSILLNIMLDTWCETICSKFNHSLLANAMKLIDKERNGDAIDYQLVIDLRNSYIDLGCHRDNRLIMYQDEFLKFYIKSTETFYKINASDYLELNGVDEYMIYAEKHLKEELARSERYLLHDSLEMFEKFCVEILICSYSETIISECPRMMKRNETDKLRLMFALFNRTPDITPLLNAVEKHIVDAGLGDMKDATIVQDPEKYVDRLVNLFNGFTQIITEAFDDDHRFVTLKDKAFKIAINDTTIFQLQLETKFKSSPESKCPQLLAFYCDFLLKKSCLKKKLTLDEINNRLNDTVLLLPYVVNKDVFMQFYKSGLVRRLILDASIDREIEESVVTYLRNVGMPIDCTNQLAKMLQDMTISKDLNEEIKREKPLAKSLNVKILSASAWNRARGRNCVILPVELEDYILEVEEFYKNKHSGRKLQWRHEMSTGVIKFVNGVGKFDLEVNTFQMAVLFAWNERPKERISFENLKLATEMSNENLRKTLWSLVSFPKIKQQLLLFHPEVKSPKDFDALTEFWVNQEFAVYRNGKPVVMGKLSVVGKLQLSSGNEDKDDNEEIVKLRELRIQEVIVKVMKTRRNVTSAQLHSETVELLKNLFLPSKKMIKDQVEFLINSEYMRRDVNNFNSFIYLA